MVIREQLENLLNLRSNWDHFGGIRISKSTVTLAKEIVARMPEYSWQATPLSSGSIQLEHHHNGVNLEIYVGARKK